MGVDQYNSLSLTAYFLKAKFNDVVLAEAATCFFIKRESKTYLITNWHVVTGKNSETNKCIRDDCAIPDRISINVLKNGAHVEFEDFEIRLFEGERPVWLEHPVYKSDVDVVAIEVHIPNNLLVIPLNECIEPFNEDTIAEISNDVFILGFPFGLSADGFPIWKRASVASEPIVDIGGMPKLLVDTASRSGMSGAAVVLFEKRAVTLVSGSSDGLDSKISRHRMKIVGVYSGRIGAKNELDKKSEDVQLGIVWKAKVIDEIISQQGR